MTKAELVEKIKRKCNEGSRSQLLPGCKAR